MFVPSILIVDDISAVRGFVKKLISPLNAKISEAEDGLEALQAVTASNFDLIITDYQMPKMDGASLCQQLKNNTDTQAIPVIMLSDFDSAKDINRGFEAGANAYISKADANEQLLPTAQKIIEKSQFQKDQLILIVDDEISVSKLLVKGLSSSGFQTMQAENGIEALQCITRHTPDLILSDIAMPEINDPSYVPSAVS